MEHENDQDYSNEPPLTLSERVSTYSARRASKMRVATLGSLRMTDEAILTEPAVPNKRRQPLTVIPHVYLAWVPANALNQNLQLPPTGEVDGRPLSLPYFVLISKPCYLIGN